MVIEIRDEVVALSGVLRRNHWRTLESAVNVRLRHHPAGIVVDCSGLEAITPEGAQTFRDAAAHIAGSAAAGDGATNGTGAAAGAPKARIVLAGVPSPIMRVLRQVPNLGSQLPVAASVADARASLGLSRTPRVRAAGGSPRAGDGGATASVVAGLLGTPADPHAVAIAGQVARASGASVYLVYLLVVPRHVPLLSALGEEEAAARQVLDSLENAARAQGLSVVPRVERTRDPAGRLVEVAAELGAEAITLALPPDPDPDLIAVAKETLARARCDVLVDRLAPGQLIAAAGATAMAAGKKPLATAAAGSSSGGGH